jgi:hypothetical protein
MTTVPAEPVLRAVLGQIDWWWSALFHPRVRGLTDEESMWEPAPRCWTVHAEADGLTRVDYHWPPPQPPPLTTIGWRLAHIGLMLAGRTTGYFPEHAPEPWGVAKHVHTTPFPIAADAGIAFVERWWTGWRTGLVAAGEAALWQPYGGVEGSYPEMQLAADDPFIGMVLHTHRELIHHGAEIAALRDLYLARRPRDAYVDAILDGDVRALDRLERNEPDIVARYRAQRADLPMRAAETGRSEPIRLVAERGFDLDALVDGHTALHHIVANGDLQLVETAIAIGADPSVKDTTYDANALGWAVYFGHHDIVEALRGRGDL